jgi:thiol-disulfide isomerase/thioredoxin
VSTKAQRRADAIAQRKRAADAAAARQRRNRLALWGGLAVVVVVAIIVAVVASGGGDSAKATSFETHAVTVDGTPLPSYDATKSPDPGVGKTIPTLEGVSVMNGKPVTVKPNGKPQMVLFVAHWCPHCQAEVPRLVDLAKQGVFDGVEVTAVATGTNSTYPNYPPSAWLQRVNWPFPVMADSPQFTAATAHRRGADRPGQGRPRGVEGGHVDPALVGRQQLRTVTLGRSCELGRRLDSVAGCAHPDQVEAMVLRAEAGAARDRGRGGGDRTLEARRRGDVLHPPARRADEVVVVSGEILGQLPARELVGADDAVHDPGVLQHDEVAVHRALCEPGPVVEDLGNGERSRRGNERVEQ